MVVVMDFVGGCIRVQAMACRGLVGLGVDGGQLLVMGL